jgi:hypothetical protein
VSSSTKKTYLACYDYTTGGVWVLIDADSAEQVERVYHDLKVFHSKPQWLDDNIMGKIETRMHFDIDAPSGWLLNLQRSDLP